MHVEFEKLEQRPGRHTVPVKMSREDLESVAEKMANVNMQISQEHMRLSEFSADVKGRIKKLEEQRMAATETYRFKREPKPVDGMYGFDPEDQGRARCKMCVERYDAKKAEGDGAGVPSYDDVTQMIADHEYAEPEVLNDKDGNPASIYPKQIGPKHTANPVWERPLGTKWFLDQSTGDVYGPLAITEKDLQAPLPETKNIEPVKLAFDTENAVPLLDAREVSAATKKLKETEKEIEQTREAVAEDVHEECGLPLAWHDPEATDRCKAAMLRAANEAQSASESRTAAIYGADETLEPEQTYPCGECGTSTFGRDLQPVTIGEDGAKKFVCFSCEQGVKKNAPPPKKAKGSRKKKGGDNVQPQAE